MALVRALLIFALLWAGLALGVSLLLHLTRRQRWAAARLLMVSGVGALLATLLLWGVVAFF